MIKIAKPAKVPKSLTNKGVAENKINCDAFDVDSATMLSTLEIKPKIYGSKAVKKSLKKAQHDKCCFCEKEQTDEYGAVEHFRPKMGYKLTRKQRKLMTPGYYWLAYEWSNLFFVCGACNTTYKGNLFPLNDESKRAKSHHDDISAEIPFLLNPQGPEDPRNHIYFKDNLVMFKTEFGERTIEICGLNRDALNNKRKKLLSDIEARLAILIEKEKFPASKIKSAKEYILECQKPQAEFSSTAIDYLTQFNLSLS